MTDFAKSLIEAAFMAAANPGTTFADHLPPCSHAYKLRLAGEGDLMALRVMANDAYEAALAYAADDDVTAIAYTEAITFARLAATRGHARDREVLLFLYAQFASWQAGRGRDDIATRFEAAGLNLAEDLADEGNEELATMVANAGDALSAETFAEAKRQRAAQREPS